MLWYLTFLSAKTALYIHNRDKLCISFYTSQISLGLRFLEKSHFFLIHTSTLENNQNHNKLKIIHWKRDSGQMKISRIDEHFLTSNFQRCGQNKWTLSTKVKLALSTHVILQFTDIQILLSQGLITQQETVILLHRYKSTISFTLVYTTSCTECLHKQLSCTKKNWQNRQNYLHFTETHSPLSYLV